QVQRALDRFTRNWTTLKKGVETGVFPCKTSALCGWCPLVNTCPAAIAEDKEPRKDGLPTAKELSIPVKTAKADDGLDSLIRHLEEVESQDSPVDVFQAAEAGHEDTDPAHPVGGTEIEEFDVIK